MGTALVVGAVLLGLLLLLAVPFDIAFHAHGIEPLAGQARVVWLFGLVRLRMPVRSRRGRKKAGERKPARVAQQAERRRGAGSRALAVLRQPAFRRRALRLLTDLMRAAHLRDLRLRLRIGLGDPADTGILWGLLAPMCAATLWIHPADVQIEPSFQEAALDFEAEGRMRLFPLQILGLALAFLLAPASMRAWWTLRGSGG